MSRTAPSPSRHATRSSPSRRVGTGWLPTRSATPSKYQRSRSPRRGSPLGSSGAGGQIGGRRAALRAPIPEYWERRRRPSSTSASASVRSVRSAGEVAARGADTMACHCIRPNGRTRRAQAACSVQAGSVSGEVCHPRHDVVGQQIHRATPRIGCLGVVEAEQQQVAEPSDVGIDLLDRRSDRLG